MQSTAGTPWSFVLQAGKRLRYVFDRGIARWSLVPTDPVLDPALLAWTDTMRDQWEMIRDEAFAIMRAPGGVPTLAEVSPDHGRIALGGWRSFFLRAYDYPVPANMRRCPGTSAALAKIPTLNSAFFSILAPGASIPGASRPDQGDHHLSSHPADTVFRRLPPAHRRSRGRLGRRRVPDPRRQLSP